MSKTMEAINRLRSILLRWWLSRGGTVILILFFLLLLLGAYALQEFGPTKFQQLGANLLSEFVGAFVAIFGLDLLMRRAEARRLLPIRATAYEDVRLTTSWLEFVLASAFRSCSNGPMPTKWVDLLSGPSWDHLRRHLDLNAQAPRSPSASWCLWLADVGQEARQQAEKTLERHQGVLDPGIYSAVHEFAGMARRLADIPGLWEGSGVAGRFRPSNLGSHLPSLPGWTEAIVKIHAWAEQECADLQAKGVNAKPPNGSPATYHSAEPMSAFLSEADVLRQEVDFRRSRGLPP